MDRRKIYEYYQKDGKIQVTCHDAKELKSPDGSSFYRIIIGRNRFPTMIHDRDFDLVENNRIFSYSGDMEIQRSRFMAYYEKRHEKTLKILQREELILEKLKEDTKVSFKKSEGGESDGKHPEI